VTDGVDRAPRSGEGLADRAIQDRVGRTNLLLDTCVWGGANDELPATGHDVLWTGDLSRSGTRLRLQVYAQADQARGEFGNEQLPYRPPSFDHDTGYGPFANCSGS
jgi:hypothetical protein